MFFKSIKDFLFIITIQGRNLGGSLCTYSPSILFQPSPFLALLHWTTVWLICVIWIHAGYRDLDENCNILDFNWIPPTSQSQEAGVKLQISVESD